MTTSVSSEKERGRPIYSSRNADLGDRAQVFATHTGDGVNRDAFWTNGLTFAMV